MPKNFKPAISSVEKILAPLLRSLCLLGRVPMPMSLLPSRLVVSIQDSSLRYSSLETSDCLSRTSGAPRTIFVSSFPATENLFVELNGSTREEDVEKIGSSECHAGDRLSLY